MSLSSLKEKAAPHSKKIIVILAVVLGGVLIAYNQKQLNTETVTTKYTPKDILRGKPHIPMPRAKTLQSAWRFEKNIGQAPAAYQYVLRTPYFSAGFGDNKIVANISKYLLEEVVEDGGRELQVNSISYEFQKAKKTDLFGVQGAQRNTYSYIGNNKERWNKNIESFMRLQQRDIYDGVQISFSANTESLVYSLYVEPKHSIEHIKIAVGGSESLNVDKRGNLIIKTTGGEILQTRPRFFEVSGKERQELSGRYVLLGDNRFGFSVKGRDPNKALVIDPEIAFATYFGGSRDDAYLGADSGAADFIGRGYDIKIGSDGDLHIIGRTTSLDFPTSDGGVLNGAMSDMFVLRIDPDALPGDRVKYAVLIGGGSEDNGRSIAVLEDSSVYITGWSAGGFPTSTGVVQATRVNSGAVVAKLGPEGQFLLGTYIGSASSNHPNSIAYEKRAGEAEGFIYLGGSTRPPGGDATPGVVQSTFGGGTYDGFITKLDLALTRYDYFTYLGGSGRDVIYDIDVADGWVFASGTTASFDFPGGFLGTSPHVHSESGNPNCDGTLARRECADAFVARLYRDGSDLLYSNYYGEGKEEYARGIAVSSATSEAYFTGARREPGLNTSTIYVTKISSSGESVIWEKTWDGTGFDHGEEIMVDPFGRAHVVGTISVDGYLTGLNNNNGYLGESDMFYARVKAGTDVTPTPGTPPPGDVEYFAYFGGSAADRGFAIDGIGSATDAFCVYPVGATVSQDVSVVNPLEIGSSLSGGSDMLIYGLCDIPPDIHVFKSGPPTASPGDSFVYSVTIVNAGDEGVNVDVSDAVPASVSVTGVDGCAHTGNNVACTTNVGFVPETITIGAELPSNACDGPRAITNTVEINYVFDGEQRTKTASHTLNVNCPVAPAVCGNGIIEPPKEECEPDVPPLGDICRPTDCKVIRCGDEIIDTDYGETCDPPNPLNRCSEFCRVIPPRCGDGIRDPQLGEECDDRNNVSGDGCRANCRIERCGDGIHDPQEVCEDGNNRNGDGCRYDCTPEVCGDGIRDPEEECDSPGDPCCENCEVRADCGESCRFPQAAPSLELPLCGGVCPVCQRTVNSPTHHKVCFLFLCWWEEGPSDNDVLLPLWGRCAPPGSPVTKYEYYDPR